MQARSFRVGFLLLLWCLAPGIALAWTGDDYGPACQWIRLFGEIERPSGIPQDEPLLLTVTYRLPDQKAPATLLVNFPIRQSKFVFVLAGFAANIQGVRFVPPDFFFADRIEFKYFATTSDHRWRSEQQLSVYRPERVKKNGQVLCQTAIRLEPLKIVGR